MNKLIIILIISFKCLFGDTYVGAPNKETKNFNGPKIYHEFTFEPWQISVNQVKDVGDSASNSDLNLDNPIWVNADLGMGIYTDYDNLYTTGPCSTSLPLGFQPDSGAIHGRFILKDINYTTNQWLFRLSEGGSFNKIITLILANGSTDFNFFFRGSSGVLQNKVFSSGLSDGDTVDVVIMWIHDGTNMTAGVFLDGIYQSGSRGSTASSFNDDMDILTINANEAGSFVNKGICSYFKLVSFEGLGWDSDQCSTWCINEANDYNLKVSTKASATGAIGLNFDFSIPQSESIFASWALDEGSGDSAYDLGGDAHNGYLNGVTWTSDGLFTNGAFFDNVADCIELDSFDITTSNGLTIMAWVHFDSLNTGVDARIISKADGATEADHYFMISSSFDGDFKWRSRLKIAGTTHTMFADSGFLVDSVWTHIAFTYDGSSMKLYSNAVQVGDSTISGAISTDNTVPVVLGNNPLGANNAMWGTLNDVKILKEALTADELKTIYNWGLKSVYLGPHGSSSTDTLFINKD